MTVIRLPHLGNRSTFSKGLDHLRSNDSIISNLIDKHGPIKFKPEGEMFESLVESIIYQQLAGSAASAIMKRVRELYAPDGIEPEAIYRTPVSRLRKAGVSPQKIRYLKDLSSRVVKGKLDLERIKTLPDPELIEELDQVLGIGPWTAQMLLIFTLGRPDVLPVDDLGIRKSIQNLYALGELPKPEKIIEIASKWHPYCSVASLYLWREKDST
ncbi:MAG TPA: DNA-3-methyladenine glycosylase 2 family protein [Nitrososphaerales archaeon]|nr:DNA-3-methyladenine glycosylase 2 family protein [Nitrososphaerales archaeon]